MGFGGPVWHVSVASRGIPYGRAVLEAQAERELQGLGDPALGEWRESSGWVFHLRRRLNAAEQVHVGPVLDVRGTDEARRRARQLGRFLRHVPPEVLADEIG